MEKIAEIRGKINPHYNMTALEMNEIYESASGSYDSICCAFCYGYMQGMKAEKSAMRSRPKVQPGFREDWRQAIYYEVCRTKNTLVLRDLYAMSDLFRRWSDDKEYDTLSEDDYKRISIIRDALHCPDGQ